jgi:hypothetical protein
MKNIVFIIIITAASCLFTHVKAQDATAKLNEAENAYSSHNLDGTRSALQDALNEINKAIGKEILDILPTKFSDISYNEKDDNVTGSAGFAGLYVNRTYGTSVGKNAKIEIMGDSPLVTSINAILSMPMLMGSSESSGKKITINGYKALLKKNSGDNQNVSYTIQIPLNQTMLTFSVNGIPGESDVINLANTIPIDKIMKIAQ